LKSVIVQFYGHKAQAVWGITFWVLSMWNEFDAIINGSWIYTEFSLYNVLVLLLFSIILMVLTYFIFLLLSYLLKLLVKASTLLVKMSVIALKVLAVAFVIALLIFTIYIIFDPGRTCFNAFDGCLTLCQADTPCRCMYTCETN